MSNIPATTMRALLLPAPDAPFAMHHLPTPVPAPGEVLVRIHASGVNPLDTKIRAGAAAHARHALPAVLGMDLAGTVQAVGPGVTDFQPGDAVYGFTGGIGGHQGSLADHAAVDARLLALKPAALSMREAAALPLVFITAWEGLVDRAQVRPGHKVLVHGGAGGVGHVAIQLARPAARRSGPRAVPRRRTPSAPWARRPSTTRPRMSTPIWQSTPRARASTWSVTPWEARRWMRPSGPCAATPGMWSARWVGAPTPWRPCPSGAPATPACSRCCPC